MRSTTFTLNSIKAQILYPEAVCFVFNPNFLEIRTESELEEKLRISVSVNCGTGSSGETLLARTRTIEVSMYNRYAKIYLSRLFELMFEEPETTRSLRLIVSVTYVGATTAPLFLDLLCIWGNLAIGERFNALGVFRHDTNRRYFERNIVWFRNFPFKVSLYKYTADLEFRGMYDNARYNTIQVGWPNTTKLSAIDDFTENIATIIETAITPASLVYFSRMNRLLAQNSNGQYSTKWNEAAGIKSSSICLKDGKPSTDCRFELTDENGLVWMYDYDGFSLVNNGIRMNTGFFDVLPSRFFNLAQKSATIKYKIGEEEAMFSTFDTTFDYTFFRSGEDVAFINLIINNDTAGYYLRWIDRHGCLQYYLFTKGKKSTKNKLGSDKVLLDVPVHDMYFANHIRIRKIDGTVTHKCCATKMSEDVYNYVESIVTAPIIDLYCGKDKAGREIWQPVNIASTTATFDPKTLLHDLEISFTTPDVNAQTL